VGGPIALVEDGDRIAIDSVSKTISWSVSDEEQARRRDAWEKSDKKKLTVNRGVLYRYARDVAVRSTSLSGVTSISYTASSRQTSEPTAIEIWRDTNE
jgi:dihydroxyacid dehydratase/phosphogluconate dehydratase